MPFSTNQRSKQPIILVLASTNLTSSGRYPGILFETRLAHSSVFRRAQPYSGITLSEIFVRMRPCQGRASTVSDWTPPNSARLLEKDLQRKVEDAPAQSATLSWIIKTSPTWLWTAARALRVSRVVKVLRQAPPTILSPILACQRLASRWPACSDLTGAMPSKRLMIASGHPH